jgi:MFS family permease
VSESHKAPDEAPLKVPIASQAAIYATGCFGNASENVYSVILPLWAIMLGASPLMVGILIGARHFLSAGLAIHGGALMDQIGTRRVLLAVGIIGAVTPWLYPTMPWLWAIFMLQLIGGLSSAFGWMGAQAQVGEVMKGSPLYASRMSFCLRFTQISGPPMAGIAWDLGGPWGGFTFLGIWGISQFLAILALPKPPETKTETDTPRPRLKMGDAIPRLANYQAAFALLAVPAIALIIMLTVLRISSGSIHFSFYVVYLKEIGYTGTLIGTLIGAGSFFGFGGALSAVPLAKRFPVHWLLIICVAGTVFFVFITPLLGAVFIMLLAAAAGRGIASGLSQPLMITMLSQAAGPGNQGKAVGLRATANRMSSSLIPVLMGLVIEVVGLEAGFYVFGSILMALLIPIICYAKRRRVGTADESSHERG